MNELYFVIVLSLVGGSRKASSVAVEMTEEGRDVFRITTGQKIAEYLLKT